MTPTGRSALGNFAGHSFCGPLNGGQRGYGYTDDRTQVIKAEATVIREYAQWALAGESLTEMAYDMNARGLTTSTGRSWSQSALKLVLISARISGRPKYRPTDSYEHGHKPLLGEITATGCWPTIISVTDSDRLRAKRFPPGEGRSQDRSRRRQNRSRRSTGRPTHRS